MSISEKYIVRVPFILIKCNIFIHCITYVTTSIMKHITPYLEGYHFRVLKCKIMKKKKKPMEYEYYREFIPFRVINRGFF